MAYKPLYLEPDEEITSVIDKIKNAPEQQLALVLAKNSSLFQSLVNLKLLAKEGKRLEKTVILITTNKVGAKLASQVGLATYGALGAVPSTAAVPAAPPVSAPADEVIDGIKVKQYDPNRQHQPEPTDKLEEELAADETPVPEQPEPEPAATPAAEPTKFEPKSVMPNELPEAKPAPKEEELPAVISRSSGFSQKREFKIPWKSVAVGAGILLFVFLLAFVFVPRATVTVTFPAHPLSETVSIAAVANLQEQQKNTITGNELTVEKTKTEKITATGKKDVGTKATGTITITNRYTDGNGVGKDQTFAAGTRVTHSESKEVFTLDEAVTIGRVTYDPNNGQPIYKSKSVEVSALEPGESYNVAAGSFSVAGALSNTPASSSKAFTGGLTKEVTVLSQDDVDTVILKLRKAAKEEALSELTTAAAGQKILSDGIWEDVKEEDTDQPVGAQVNSTTARVVVEYGVVAFDEAAARSIFTAAFDGSVTADEEMVFSEEDPPLFTAKKIERSKKRLNFEISGTAFKVPKIDRGELAKTVANKSAESAKGLLADRYKAQAVEVKISPSWWMDRLPLLSQAIRVEYGFNDDTAVQENSEEAP